MEAPLDRADEGHVAAKGDGLVRSADRLIDVGRGSIMRVTRLREHIEHRPEVGVDRLLEGDDLRVRDVHVAIDMGLERPGIRHDGSWKSEERVDAVAYNRVPVR